MSRGATAQMHLAPVQPGDVLGDKFRVERVLGAGGMGVVVAATHLQLDERVALKFLLPAALERPDVVARFAREARAAAKIKSEHIARVSDVGSLPNGAPYMVMEYLEGQDLNQLLRRDGALPPPLALDYVLQACEALAEAHHLGIIHRDLKPANLFLTLERDGTQTIKVLDFGISKVADAPEGGLTTSDSMLGSPLYMSPEQMMASSQADARSDIWSLGVTLHELMSRQNPFAGDSLPEICSRILQGEPTDLHAVKPHIPAGLGAVVRRCLAKNPAERFASVGELALALQPFAPGCDRSVQRILRRLAGGDPSSSALRPLVASSSLPSSIPPGAPSSPGSSAPAMSLPGAASLAPPPSSPPVARIALVAFAGAAVVAMAAVGLFLGRRAATAPAASTAPAAPATTPSAPALTSAAPPATDAPAAATTTAAPAASAAPASVPPTSAPPVTARATASAPVVAPATAAGKAPAGAPAATTPAPVTPPPPARKGSNVSID